VTHKNSVIIILVVGYHPVVEVIKDKGTGKEDDGYEIKKSWLFVNHVGAVPERRRLVVNTVVVFVPLQSVDGEDESVFEDCAEDHEDARHHELVDGVQLAGRRRRGAGANVVEDVDDDQEEDDEERHATGDDLWVDHKAYPGHRHKEAAGDVDLIDQWLVLPLKKDLEPTGGIIA